MYLRYWPFGAVCLIFGAIVFWLLLHRRLTLQSSLLYLLLLVGMGVGSVLLPVGAGFIRALGFALPSNFAFAVAIGALSALHLGALVTISRLEARSITLAQDLALLEERVQRLAESPGPEFSQRATSAEQASQTDVMPAPRRADLPT